MKLVETEQDIPENISIPIKGRSGDKFFSLVTCHSLFKQTSKKENPSSCFTTAPLKNSNACNSFQDTVSVILSDFEFHSPSALLHLVLLSGLAAIRKILEEGELFYFYKLSY